MGRIKRDRAWTIAELKKLGRIPDSILARKTSRTLREIQEQREARAIALPTAPRRWTAREIRLLGKFNDTEVARRLRRRTHEVRRERLGLRIPILKPAAPSKHWTIKEVRLLGTRPDSELAKRFRRTITSLELKRSRLGIPMFNNPYIWKPEHAKLLGKMPDRELAKLTGRTLDAVRAMRIIRTGIRLSTKAYPPVNSLSTEQKDWLRHLKASEVAAKIGCSLRTVSQLRKKFHIRIAIPRKRRTRLWTPREDSLL